MKNIRSNKPALFLIFCLAVTLILTTQLSFKYFPDFEGKNIPTWVILKLLALGAANFLAFGVLFSIVFTTASLKSDNTESKRNFILAFLFGLLISLFSSFLQPKLYSQELELLYAVKLKAPEDNLNIERGLFENQISTMTLPELVDLSNEFEPQRGYSDLQKANKRIIDMLFWPISAIVFCFLGTILSARIKGLTLTIKIIAITFLVLPIWYYSGKLLNPISSVGTSMFTLDKLIPELILTGLAILIIKVTNNR